MTIITSTINGQMYIEILDNCIPSIKNYLEDEVIFQDDKCILLRSEGE